MTYHRKTANSRSEDLQDQNGLEDLGADLSPTGRVNLQRITQKLGELAPRPGSIVYIRAKPLTFRLNGLEPVVFSAIDCSTHLQVAQAYHSTSTAAAISFVEFAAQSFPFRISEIRTSAERPFHNASAVEPHRDFAAILGEKGFVHAIIEDPSRDALASITSSLIFGGISDEAFVHLSTQELQRTLTNHIFCHNNYVTVPWLGGKTPLQKLKTFKGFSAIRTFTPYMECEPSFIHRRSGSEETNILKAQAARII